MSVRSLSVSRRDPAAPGAGFAVLAMWLITRLLMVVVAQVVMARTGRTFTQVVANWDVQHYQAIATAGYQDPVNMAFFPGLPLLLRGANQLGVPMELAGVILAALGSLLAAGALLRLAGAPAACLWLLAPMGVFTMVGYTEALFAAAAFWAWDRARAGRWAAVGLLAAAACLLRISGVFLLVGLGLLALFGDGPGFRPPAWRWRLHDLGWLVLPVVVLAGFVVYLHGLSGHWDAWLSAQQTGWQRGITNPWQSLRNTLFAVHESAWPAEPTRAWMFRFEIASVAVGYLTALGCLIARQWARAGYMVSQVLALSSAYWFMSVNRGVLLWFPLFIGLGAVAGWQPRSGAARVAWRILLGTLAVADAALMCWWASLFFRGMWAS